MIRLLDSFTVFCGQTIHFVNPLDVLLTGHLLKELEAVINSLSDGVKLIKSIPKRKRMTLSREVWVFEVDVVCDGDELIIQKKVNDKQ